MGLSVGLVCSGVRAEEKLLVSAFRDLGVQLHLVDVRRLGGPLHAWPRGLPPVDVALLRAKSHWRNVALARWLEFLDVPVVNPSHVLDICGDKVATSLALARSAVPMVPAAAAFSSEGGRAAVEELGYPLVVKPVIGSWGRLVGRVNDEHALETVLEHKEALGGAPHAVTFLQTFVSSGGRDIRTFVIGGRCVAAIARDSEHWRTNTALGARVSALDVSDGLGRISVSAAEAVGGGALAVDLFEVDGEYLVNEVNGTMEFRNSVGPTGVDIPRLLAEHVLGHGSPE